MFSRYKKPTGGKPSLVEVSTEKPESAAVAEAPAQVQRRPAAHRKQPVVTPGQVVPMDKEKKGAYILSLTGRFAGCRGPRLSCNAVAEEWFSGHGPLCYVRTD